MRQILWAAVFVAGACSGGSSGTASSSAQAQLKPETLAGCNAVKLDVDIGADGVIKLNGDASTMGAVRQAAIAKDAACQNAPAMVTYSYDAAAPAGPRDAIKLMLKQTIVHLTLIEMGRG
jgi:hypothetical protein